MGNLDRGGNTAHSVKITSWDRRYCLRKYENGCFGMNGSVKEVCNFLFNDSDLSSGGSVIL